MRGARITLPPSVVYRAFPSETVVLNLSTGKYHGLNPTAGRMLEVLEQVGDIRAAVPRLASEYGRASEEVEADLRRLCVELADRGLIEVDEIAQG